MSKIKGTCNLKVGLLYYSGRVSSTSSGSGAKEKAVSSSSGASRSKRATKKTTKATSTDELQSEIDEQQRLAMVIKFFFPFFPFHLSHTIVTHWLCILFYV
jgi:hypothetical protein